MGPCLRKLQKILLASKETKISIHSRTCKNFVLVVAFRDFSGGGVRFSLKSQKWGKNGILLLFPPKIGGDFLEGIIWTILTVGGKNGSKMERGLTILLGGIKWYKSLFPPK